MGRIPTQHDRRMTQAEEVAYWQGYDHGRSRDGDLLDCRYSDQGLEAAYAQGWDDGCAVRRGAVLEEDGLCPMRPAGARGYMT